MRISLGLVFTVLVLCPVAFGFTFNDLSSRLSEIKQKLDEEAQRISHGANDFFTNTLPGLTKDIGKERTKIEEGIQEFGKGIQSKLPEVKDLEKVVEGVQSKVEELKKEGGDLLSRGLH